MEYKDSDLLRASQVAEVLSRNSARSIRSSQVAALLRLRGVDGEPVTPRLYLYKYSDIKSLVVAPGRPWSRKVERSNSPNAIRKRRFDERRRAAAAAAVSEVVQ